MSIVTLDLNQLRELLAAINQTDIAELTLKSDDFELTVRRGGRIEPPAVTTTAAPTVESQTIGAMPTVSPATIAPLVEAAPSPISAQTTASPPSDRGKLADIASPMVGTFYRSPAPDEPPFVDVGDRIRKGQAVCIIEAMKLMNELEAEISGEIVEIMVQNGQPVEFGQTLMRVKPD